MPSVTRIFTETLKISNEYIMRFENSPRKYYKTV